MRPAQAADIAHELYDDHPAAASLIVEATHGATEERRHRSAQALRWLDPMNDGFELSLSLSEDACLRALRWAVLGHQKKDRIHAADDASRLLLELATA